MRKVGLLSFSDGRERVHKTLIPEIERNITKLSEFLARREEIEVIKGSEIIYTPKLARRETQSLLSKGIDLVIFNIPVFAFPNLSIIAAQFLDIPILIYSPANGKLPGLGGLLAAAGSLRQLGRGCEKVWGDLNKKEVRKKFWTFLQAASAASRLRGQVYGLIGGRSIGMNTGMIDTAQWARQFGIDVEHIDQLEIIRLANKIPDEKVEEGFRWLGKNVKQINYNGDKLTPETLKYQLKCYLATRRTIEEKQLDFISVKCHYELSENYVTQCVNCTLCNDPYDWRGKKEPTVFACEADSDGALTMQILKLISGLPTLFIDLRHYDEKEGVYVFCNCGAQSTWFAERSENPEHNLKKVTLYPVIPKYKATGAHLQYQCKEGEITFARLGRDGKGQYEMAILKGEFVEFPMQKLRETCWEWPHAYARIDIPPDKLIDVWPANHFHAVSGNYIAELMKICEILKIKPVLLTNTREN